MNEDERKDLELFKAEQQKLILSTYNYLLSLSKLDATGLKHSGYTGKTNAEAVYLALLDTEKRIKKVVDNHIKKYPDGVLNRLIFPL